MASCRSSNVHDTATVKSPRGTRTIMSNLLCTVKNFDNRMRFIVSIIQLKRALSQKQGSRKRKVLAGGLVASEMGCKVTTLLEKARGGETQHFKS